MLTDQMLDELQERVSLARLEDIRVIKVDIKILEALLESIDKNKIIADVEYENGPSEKEVTEIQEKLLHDLSNEGE